MNPALSPNEWSCPSEGTPNPMKMGGLHSLSGVPARFSEEPSAAADGQGPMTEVQSSVGVPETPSGAPGCAAVSPNEPDEAGSQGVVGWAQPADPACHA